MDDCRFRAIENRQSKIGNYMGTFQPAFKALFGGALVEQLIAMFQNNQQAAITAYAAAPGGFTPFNSQVFDQIADFHKGKVAAPQYPCLTVTASDPVFNASADPYFRDYNIAAMVHLDLSYEDPEQLSDWAYHYERILDQIMSTVTGAFSSFAFFETAQRITWPNNTDERQTTPYKPGSVKKMIVHDPHTGQVPGDESKVPVARISVPVEFHIIEQ
jgi:hypothetical protein